MAASSHLKLTKPEAGGKFGSVHIVPNTKNNKGFYEGLNANLKEGEKWKIEEIDEDAKKALEADKSSWRNDEFVSGRGGEILAEKNAELEKLKQQLAEAQAELDAKAKEVLSKKAELNTSGTVKVDEATAKILTLETVAEVEAYVLDDSRATVIKAAQARIDALNTAK